MQKILLSLLLLGSASAFAQFSEKDKQTNPNAARLLTLQGKTVAVANREDLEHPDILGKHQTFLYPDSIRATGKTTHEVAIEMRQNGKPVLREWWQIDCGKKIHFAANTATVNFVQKGLYDEPLPAEFAQFRHLKGDVSLNLDYQYAEIHGKHAFVQAACKQIQNSK
ncbi:hypothetical protein ACKLNO_02005 [Neisseriaceae bacterium B1]